MLASFNESQKQEILNMRGGEGKVFIEKLVPTLAHMKMYARITIPSGSSIGFHFHESDEEMMYVLSGSGVITAGSEKITINEGTINITKQNESHAIKNVFLEDLILLAVINEI